MNTTTTTNATTAQAIAICNGVIDTNPYTHLRCMSFEEKDNKKTYAYEVAGIKVKCEEIFENKTKSTYLHFYGEATILSLYRKFDEKIFIDTNIYDKYDWKVVNGILYVILYEKINKKPKFERVEKQKKNKEEVTE